MKKKSIPHSLIYLIAFMSNAVVAGLVYALYHPESIPELYYRAIFEYATIVLAGLAFMDWVYNVWADVPQIKRSAPLSWIAFGLLFAAIVHIFWSPEAIDRFDVLYMSAAMVLYVVRQIILVVALIKNKWSKRHAYQ